MVKPGCELNNLLESAESVSGSITHKDVIFICGGSNDFNHDQDEPVIDHITEFIKTNNHTNIVLANVPTRYDLSYHSQINKGIRSYNEKLREITKEHKQVALIEIDLDRKYHTSHGLHFNKLGKMLFANKITQMIYLLLDNKQKQSTVMNEKYKNQGDESEADRRNSNQVNKDTKNSEDKIQLPQKGVDKKVEEKITQDEDKTTSYNSEDKSVKVNFSQTINKVLLTQDLEYDELNKSVNKSVICEHPQDILDKTQPNKDKSVTQEQIQDTTGNTQQDCVDKVLETRRISTRNKKNPSTRDNDFLW